MAETPNAVPDNSPQQIDQPPYPGTTKIDNSGKPVATAAPAEKPKFDPNAPMEFTKPKFDPNAPMDFQEKKPTGANAGAAAFYSVFRSWN